MGKLIDLTGQRFGHLTVIERGDDYISPSGIPTPKWKCQCDCGNIVDVESRSLRYGKTKSCGCSKGELISLAISEDLTGQKFNRLTVIKRGEDLICKSRNVIRWLCRCECGNETLVNTSSLKSGKTKSCGCLQKEITSSKCLDNLIGRPCIFSSFNLNKIIKFFLIATNESIIFNFLGHLALWCSLFNLRA